jgi:hypothetical protein
MSLKLVALIASCVGLVGAAIGYYLRLIISLGQKGSLELEVRQMMLSAEEKAKKIIIDAGDTPSGDNFADLWKEALVAVGLTPKQSIDENRKLFYLTQK